MYDLYFEDLDECLGTFDEDAEEIVLDLDHLWCSSCGAMSEFIRNFNQTLTHELMHWFIWQEHLSIPYCEPKIREDREYDFLKIWHLSPEEQIVVEVTK